MSVDEKTIKKIVNNFELLRNIVRQNRTSDLKVDLTKIEKIINEKIPDALKKNAPANFHELFMDFKSEYEKFKDFILYDKLIGKNIVALGGGFSSGKSSFLNSLMGKEVLPSDIDPSTSVPTYIVKGDKHNTQGVNIFDTKIDMEVLAIREIAHGFGKIDDDECEQITDIVTLGHILNSIFFSTPLHKFDNIAFLDTPGYSKPDSKDYSLKTDEQIARNQLNLSNFILWFIQSDAGTITEEDIKFIKTIREDIPKLIIVNKADKKPKSELPEIVEKIKSTLDLRGIRYVDVVTYSKQEPDEYDSDKIKNYLNQWDKAVYKSSFARNFKVIFTKCREFYEKEKEEEGRRLNRLNKARTFSEDDTISECLDSLISEIKRNISEINNISEKLKSLQTEFFTEIKTVSDIVGIQMPEPSEIDLIRDNAENPVELLKEYKKKNGIKTDMLFVKVICDTLGDVNPVISNMVGGNGYKNEILKIINNNSIKDKKEIIFNDIYKTNSQFAEIINSNADKSKIIFNDVYKTNSQFVEIINANL